MLSEYFLASRSSKSGGELTQLCLHFSLFVWLLCTLFSHIYFLLLIPSSICLVSPVDAEEDHEVAASGAGDEDKEQELKTGTADEVDHDIQEIIV
jgi:hypothetical protein